MSQYVKWKKKNRLQNTGFAGRVSFVTTAQICPQELHLISIAIKTAGNSSCNCYWRGEKESDKGWCMLWTGLQSLHLPWRNKQPIKRSNNALCSVLILQINGSACRHGFFSSVIFTPLYVFKSKHLRYGTIAGFLLSSPVIQIKCQSSISCSWLQTCVCVFGKLHTCLSAR